MPPIAIGNPPLIKIDKKLMFWLLKKSAQSLVEDKTPVSGADSA
jgi:hypothetical protein